MVASLIFHKEKKNHTDLKSWVKSSPGGRERGGMVASLIFHKEKKSHRFEILDEILDDIQPEIEFQIYQEYFCKAGR